MDYEKYKSRRQKVMSSLLPSSVRKNGIYYTNEERNMKFGTKGDIIRE